jgi:hypothetical protein
VVQRKRFWIYRVFVLRRQQGTLFSKARDASSQKTAQAQEKKI